MNAHKPHKKRKRYWRKYRPNARRRLSRRRPRKPKRKMRWTRMWLLKWKDKMTRSKARPNPLLRQRSGSGRLLRLRKSHSSISYFGASSATLPTLRLYSPLTRLGHPQPMHSKWMILLRAPHLTCQRSADLCGVLSKCSPSIRSRAGSARQGKMYRHASASHSTRNSCAAVPCSTLSCMTQTLGGTCSSSSSLPFNTCSRSRMRAVSARGNGRINLCCRHILFHLRTSAGSAQHGATSRANSATRVPAAASSSTPRWIFCAERTTGSSGRVRVRRRSKSRQQK